MSFDHVAALARLPLFRTSSPDDLRRFARGCEAVTLRRSEVLYKEGADADGSAFLIVQGRLVVTVGAGAGQRTLGDSKAGETVGETAIFAPGNPRSATVVADGEVHGLRFTRALLDEQVDNPAVAQLEQALMAAMARRLRRTTLGVLKMWQDSAEPTAPVVPQRSLRDRVLAWLGVDQ